MQKLFNLLLVVLILLSCSKNNPDPSWIEIKEWSLISNKTNKEGELTHNFSNAYIEIDGETIGFFQLPITLPILKTGKHTLRVSPVILNNGIEASKMVYPFCQPYSLDIELISNKTTSVTPSTSYLTDCKFWIEDFEDAGIKIRSSESYSTILSVGNNAKFLKYGKNYGEVTINNSLPTWLGITTSNSTLPKGKNIYLEVDYLNTINFTTGLYVQYNNIYNPNITVNAQNKSELKWKKIYIDLRDLVSYSTEGSIFEQYFTVNNGESTDTNFILLDNIKVIYR